MESERRKSLQTYAYAVSSPEENEESVDVQRTTQHELCVQILKMPCALSVISAKAHGHTGSDEVTDICQVWQREDVRMRQNEAKHRQHSYAVHAGDNS